MYHEAKSSFAHHGVKFSNLEIDLPAMMAQKDKAVTGLTKGIEGLFKKNKVDYMKGFGKFVSPSEVSVDLIDGGSTTVKGKNIIIATGSDVKSLPGITIDEKKGRIIHWCSCPYRDSKETGCYWSRIYRFRDGFSLEQARV
jgi:dihydrolipoamide dehydrogenase